MLIRIMNGQIDPRSAADTRAHKMLETTTFLNEQRYVVVMLLADDNIRRPTN